WRQLFDDDGALRVALPPPPLEAQVGQLGLFAAAPTTRSMLLADAVAAASRRGLALPEAVHVFGLSYVAPAFAEIFARLAATGPLHVYAINPCMEFWEDVEQADESLRRAAQGRLVHRGDKLDGFDLDASQIGGLPQDFADPFELDRPGDTPALRLWGRPGREYVRLLNQLTDCRFEAHFRDPTRGQPPTLLGLLQRDILLRAPERPVATTGEPDASIRLLACPGVRREVEIVADHIWALVRARDAAGQPLRFHQIAVMVADPRREDYLTHVDAVFRERHGLPFNVIDRPLSGQSRVIEAIERLLDLPASHFEYAELMRLLTHPAVGGADPDVDAVRWRRWGDALKIVFGADRADLEDTYIDRDVFNWDQALRRLMLGAFVTGEKAGEPRPVELSTGVWMPFETGPDALADVGRLVTLARCLIADARALRTAELSVADWAVMLARLITRYVSGTRVDDELAISRCLAALEQLGAADLEGGAVSFEVARELVRARMAGLEGGRGQHQADGVVVSSLLPMRAVPFEAVFVLGLGEGRFPAPARNHPLDLRQARRLPGDVTPAERDRYLFLETLLAARQQVFLSWVARDATSGDAVEPSAVVKELQYLLRGYVPPDRLDALVEAHPVSAFDLTYFPDLKDESSQEPARSVSSEARRGARARALRLDVHRHLVAPPPEGEALITGLSSPSLDALGPMLRLPTPPLHAPAAPERVILPLYAIQRFLESPLQGAARFVLGLRE
ncbi:MAG: exodeoxyribonuclease V subunit gamma, partial [Myxococcales bacterium]|nr:exodeoxyribonuclease V subunit gamma [Myxococcales bacterium]